MSDKFKIKSTGKTVTLNQNNFRAKGGEGSIYVIDNDAYKVCEKGKMIPEAKFAELAVLTHPRIVTPNDVLLQGNEPVGYKMIAVPGNARPLTQILTKAYQERENVTPDKKMNLVKQIYNGIEFIHAHDGYLQVDGNDYNYMVTENHDEVYFIDVNSFQTPHFAATAIMSSIRDWSVAQDPQTKLYAWSKLSDWFSFGIVSFYLFTAIHAFRGYHPRFTNIKTVMIDQMKASVSVLDPESTFPLGAVYHPFEDYIPGGKSGAYMQWYRATFIENKRLVPPKDFQAALTIIVKIQEIVGSNNFDIREIRDYRDFITAYYQQGNTEVVVTKSNKIHVNNTETSVSAERFRVGFTSKQNTPFACWLDGEKVQLQNLQNNTRIPVIISGKDFMSCEGRVYIQSSQNIFELDFIENNVLVCTPKSVASIMPNATQMYQGVVVQDMMGALMFSVFPEKGHHQQMKIPELEGFKIVDAKYEKNVLMFLVVEKTSSQYVRFVFRFSKDWRGYDVRKIENITPAGLNFTVTDRGVCISLTEEDKIEIFSNQKDVVGVKSIDDSAIDGNMHLCHTGNSVRFARGSKFYDISVKK